METFLVKLHYLKVFLINLDCKRTASAFAATHLELFVLDKEGFIDIINIYPEIGEKFLEEIQNKKLNEARVKAEQLRKERLAKEEEVVENKSFKILDIIKSNASLVDIKNKRMQSIEALNKSREKLGSKTSLEILKSHSDN